MEDYARLFYALRQRGDRSGLGVAARPAAVPGIAPYARLVERGGEDPALEEAARRDIETFTLLGGAGLRRGAGWESERRPGNFPACWPTCPGGGGGCPFTFQGLTAFYQANGAGASPGTTPSMGGWGLCPVEQPDCPGPGEMMGYELQRDQVVANTRAMLEGNLVNNVLLYGDSGTGKSATVKNLRSPCPALRTFGLIEVQKEELGGMPELIRTLAGRRRKFILFIDDLAFDQDDRTYRCSKPSWRAGWSAGRPTWPYATVQPPPSGAPDLLRPGGG